MGRPGLDPSLAGKRLLISGINGFLGIHTALLAMRSGAAVFGVDLPDSFPVGEKARSALGGSRPAILVENLTDPGGWRQALNETSPDVVINLAGTTRRDWAGGFRSNYETTSSMVRALCEEPPGRRPLVVHPGSQLEYGTAPMPWTEQTLCRPANPYAAGKLISTELLMAAERMGNLDARVVRFAIVYGPCQAPTMFIPELICDGLAGEPFKMTEGRQKRRFIYVGDAASILLKGDQLPVLLNAPASEPAAMRDVAERIAGLLGGDVKLDIGALPMRSSESLEAWPDDGLAASLGLSCDTGLDEGLRKTVEWYRDNPWFRDRQGGGRA
jgi:nucleoside-diphosphate-sugar epimerase